MTETEADTFIKPYIQLVRTGSFTSVFQNAATLAGLEDLARRKDYLGAQSAAILAEAHDQVGRYKEARAYANADIGKIQLTKLEHEIRRLRPERAVVRAHAWLLLQCAVNEFRREGGAQHGLDLLTKGIDLISANSGEAIDSQHIQSLYYFWRARILSTASYKFGQADEDFEQALRVADTTLEEKLKEADQDAHKPEKERRRSRPTELAAGAYVLSTVLSFGLANARQLQSKLVESLWFLRAAVPLSRGSMDFHRRGFAHLMMGTALRGVARQGNLREAEQQLQKAKELLDEPERHLLHLARVYHQLALCRYNDLPPGVARSREHRNLLELALKDNQDASDLSGDKSYEGFRDPLLTYGIKVARSLIQTALGDFNSAYDLAEEAIRTIGHDVPKDTHGWALVAKGMALAERVEGHDQVADIRKAENTLLIVVEDRDLRQTDRAAALLHLSRLYSKIGQPFKAEIHCKRALPLVRGSEHGWLKDLRKSAKVSLKVDTGPELRLNIEELLKAGNESRKGPWRYINRQLEVDLKRRLLARIQHQEILKQKDGESKLATALGLTRATLFTWKKDPELKPFFPSRKAAKENAS